MMETKIIILSNAQQWFLKVEKVKKWDFISLKVVKFWHQWTVVSHVCILLYPEQPLQKLCKEMHTNKLRWNRKKSTGSQEKRNRNEKRRKQIENKWLNGTPALSDQ